jgi:hypothetical protein
MMACKKLPQTNWFVEIFYPIKNTKFNESNCSGVGFFFF